MNWRGISTWCTSTQSQQHTNNLGGEGEVFFDLCRFSKSVYTKRQRHRFLYRLKRVQCSPMVLFTRNVKRSKAPLTKMVMLATRVNEPSTWIPYEPIWKRCRFSININGPLPVVLCVSRIVWPHLIGCLQVQHKKKTVTNLTGKLRQKRKRKRWKKEQNIAETFRFWFHFCSRMNRPLTFT